MKVVGLIAEYNPLHLGHQYQLQQIHDVYHPDVLVVIMSGDIVQRGEFAILSKAQRTRLALHYGADIVIELPLVTSLQSANYFAQDAVTILHAMGCDTLVFGTESANTNALQSFVMWQRDNAAQLNKAIQEAMATGIGYPSAFASAISTLRAPLTFDATLPNHALGIQYIEANLKLPSPMVVHTLSRIKQLKGQRVLSGSQVRSELVIQQSKTSISVEDQARLNGLPIETSRALAQQNTLIKTDDFYEWLYYRLVTHTPQSLRRIFGVVEGIEHHLLRVYKACDTYEALVTALVSKRWTRARVQRMLMAILLNITDDEVEQEKRLNALTYDVRILGYRESGSLLLKQNRGNSRVHLFANVKKTHYARQILSIRAQNTLLLKYKHLQTIHRPITLKNFTKE